MNTILTGDCLAVMPTLPANSVDSIITDPPYGLDFMGKSWDHGVPGVEFWQAALRVAKPGAILMAFGGTRTYHRLACAIEDAGWEMRDTMMFLYGSGFPKSLDISKAIDKAAGAEREVVGKDSRPAYDSAYAKWDKPYEKRSKHFGQGEWDITSPSSIAAHLWQGWGTALKPAWEPIIVAMKPLEGTYAENAQKWGVAGLNIDGSRIGVDDADPNIRVNPTKSNGLNSCFGIGDVDYARGPASQGRWPANLLLDEEAARLLDEQSGECKTGGSGKNVDNAGCSKGQTVFYGGVRHLPTNNGGDSGGASRFFYTAKASASERNAGLEDMEEAAPAYKDFRPNYETTHGIETPFAGTNRGGNSKNPHPTVKPVSLMRYLCKLTRTPTGGVVLDPFMGSGTTGIACILEHRDFIGIEIDENYAEIARKRIADMTGPLFFLPEVKHGDSYLYN